MNVRIIKTTIKNVTLPAKFTLRDLFEKTKAQVLLEFKDNC